MRKLISATHFEFLKNKILNFLIVFLFFSFPLFSQSKSTTKNVGCQTATIERDSVLVKLKEYKTQVSLLEAFQKQLQSEFEFRKLEFDAKLKDFQEKESTFSSNDKELIVGELQKLDEDLKQFSIEAEKKLTKKEQELLKPMNDKINAAIDVVATKQGFLQVIDRKFVYFSKAGCDATQLVVEEANKS